MKRFLNHRLLYVLLSSLIACTIQAIKLEDSPFSFGQKYRGEKFLIAGCGWDEIRDFNVVPVANTKTDKPAGRERNVEIA